MVRRQIEFAGPSGDPGALLDRHQPFVLAKILADLAGHREQRCARALDVGNHLLEHVLGDLRVVAQGEQDLLLALEFLHQVRFEVRAAGDFQNFKQRQERGVVRERIFLGKKMTGPLEQVLEAQQRPDSFAERILVGDHRGAGDSRGRSLILGQLCAILAHSPRIDNGRRYDVVLDFAASVRYCLSRRETWRSSASGAPLLSITSSAKARRCSRVACAGEDIAHFALREAAAPNDSLDLLGLGAIDDEHPREARSIDSALYEKWHHEDRVGAIGAFAAARALFADERMQDRLELFPRRGVAEGELAHPGAIERAVGADQARAEGPAYRPYRRASGPRELVCDLVRVDNGDPEFAEPLGDRALAAADAARESDRVGLHMNWLRYWRVS